MPDTNQNESDSDKLRRRNRELSILNSIAEALNRTLDMVEAVRVALGLVARLLDLKTGWVWLLDGETGESYLAAAQDLPPGLASHPERMEGTCYCLDTYRSGDLEGAANVNVVTCSRLKALVNGTDGLRYHASIPLYAGEEKLGVLNVASPDWRELSADDLRLLHTIGDFLSIAIERANLFGQSAQLGALEERNRLAREIHDTLAQGLSAVAMQLESADALLESGSEPERVRATIQQALSLTRVNLDEARRSVMDLRAAPLEGLSLSAALSRLVAEQTIAADPVIRFESTGGGRRLPVRIEDGLYRITQEALSNIQQHAEADRAYVRLGISSAEARLVIEDDGRGFDPSTIPAGSFGLVGMNERVKLLGGRLSIESETDQGTRLEVVIPLV